MSITMSFEGGRELEQVLEQLATPAARKASARRALRKTAEPMVPIAKGMVRVDQADLRDSIGVGTRLTRRQQSQHRRMFRDDRAAVEMFFGAGGLAQATQEEFGNWKQAPHPYIRPAWDGEKGQMLSRLSAELWADIQKAVARAERRAARLAARG